MNTVNIPSNTLRIPIVINCNDFDRATAQIQINVYSNSQPILKFTKGGGAGFDGSIDITSRPESNVFCLSLSPANAQKLKAGKLHVEGKVKYVDSNYIYGDRVIPFKFDLPDLHQLNTTFAF